MRRMRAGRDAAPARPAQSAGLPGCPGPRPTDTTVRAQGALLDGRSKLFRFASAARGERGSASPRPHAKTPRWSAGRRACPIARARDAARRRLQWLRLSALHPLGLFRGAARPATGRRINKPRSDHAWLQHNGSMKPRSDTWHVSWHVSWHDRSQVACSSASRRSTQSFQPDSNPPLIAASRSATERSRVWMVSRVLRPSATKVTVTSACGGRPPPHG